MQNALKYVLSITTVGMLAACAGNPSVPQESPISIQLKGTATEVQNFIEVRLRNGSNGVLNVENANDRVLTMKADCNRLPDRKPLQCGMLMMGIGNSRWDGPYLMMNFRTNQIRETVNVSLQSEWCAINPFGKSNCMPATDNNESNTILRKLKTAYESEVAK